MTTKDAKKLDRVLAALANEKRRRIVYTLALQPASIGQLAKQQRSSLPAIHRHIKVLEQAKLARRKKSGRVNFLALDRTGLLLVQNWTSQFHAYWGAEEETLENYVAGIERSGIKLKKLTKGK
ncbi:MAG: helix-turn-helix domain-containing protein [Patescibacteria group bacterium]